jgi:ferric iron reductase protein FhuF
MDDHLDPLVAALSGYSRLSPRVFWSNAANYVEWMVSAIASRMPAARVDDARAMLELRQRVDGRDNPLYRPVRYRTEGEGRAAITRRQRRVCCVRYLVPDRSLCANCPLSVLPGKTAEVPGETGISGSTDTLAD